MHGSTDTLFSVRGKVVLVAGGAGLLGTEIARALALEGAEVVVADASVEGAGRSLGSRELTVEDGPPVPVHEVALDVTSADAWDRARAAAERVLGPVDCLLNAAALTNASRIEGYDAPPESFPRAAWDAVLEVNLTGTFLGCQRVGGAMVERGSGSIVNFASLYGVVSPHHPIYEGLGVAQPPAYSVSKAGVLALTRYFGTLWARRGVRVNALTPGGILDGQDEEFVARFSRLCPQGRMQDASDVVGAALYLCSDASRSVVAHNLVVDGGWTAW